MSKSTEDIKEETNVEGAKEGGQTDARPIAVIRLDRLPGNEGKTPQQFMQDIVKKDRARAEWIAERIQEATKEQQHGELHNDDSAKSEDKLEGTEKAGDEPAAAI